MEDVWDLIKVSYSSPNHLVSFQPEGFGMKGVEFG